MNNYQLHITSKISEEKLQKGIFIFIFRASKIPPHLGIIANGLLYDITAIGPTIDLLVSGFYKTIFKRKTEVIFVELKQAKNNLSVNQIITNKVNYYKKVTPNISCLNPIKDFIKEVYQIDVNHTNFIFELLPFLYENNLIKGVSALNVSKKLFNNTFELTKYTRQDIDNCINALTRKKTVC